MPKIARVWFGKTVSSKADEYFQYVEQTGVRNLLETPGNEGVLLLRSADHEITEIGVMSIWESLNAIQGFAGDDIGRAVYYPEDDRFLLKKEPRVIHYEISLAKGIKLGN